MLKDEKIVSAVKHGDIEVDNLWIEIWRGCPFNCEHCYHGPAQNVAMPQATMEAILDNYDGKLIDEIRLTGGEQSSNVEALEKFADALDRKKTKFRLISLVTNGWNMSDGFFKIIDRTAQLSQSKLAIIEMSNDFVHTEQYKRLGLDYSERLSNFLKAPDRWKGINTVNRAFQSKEQMDILPVGNAKKLQTFNSDIKQNSKILTFERNFFKPGAALLHDVNFDAKGNITLPIIEYTVGDENNFGNVHKDDLTKIYLEYGQEAKFI
jgi:sulfatase maturation enzyme AslB (radical SAM superfamily)